MMTPCRTQPPPEIGPGHSAALIEDLTAQKTAALRVEHAGDPRIAVVAVVHALLLKVGYTHAGHVASALEIRLSSAYLDGSLKNPEDCKPIAAMHDLRKGFNLPAHPGKLWDWCLEQSEGRLLSLLAYAAGQSVNVARKSHDALVDAGAHGNQLGRALGFDMTKWFVPTAANYFGHINRARIESAVGQAKDDEAAMQVRAAAKKTEAAIIAERLVADVGWLPEPLRFAEPAPIDEDDLEDDGHDDETDQLVDEFPEAAD
ncbi:chromosome partitioning protein, ParB family [Bradyrhizobium brasilense]|uniref:Chromosome partitioning protein, ParB family n=1 Tax=Bradyrhizobium brasilense TaxID=1419277 RepID=A0A1G7HQH4_9BRAD|nr:hypothetical protein [Bradyrhizobium brasilense]SDF02548.1 chromosome partitioning protein, ParB family [Bradyrhizobium brasilense]